MAKLIEKEVRRRCNDRCEYCHLPQAFSKLKFPIDHVIAKQHGGAKGIDNLALACGFCNRHKGPNIAGLDPESGVLCPLFHPRRDDWHEHLRWEGTIVVGRTAIGRTTITVLNMNHPYQLAIRQALLDEGVLKLD